jgi:hypothetical protein
MAEFGSSVRVYVYFIKKDNFLNPVFPTVFAACAPVAILRNRVARNIDRGCPQRQRIMLEDDYMET